MPLAFEISRIGGDALPALQRLAAGLEPGRINPIVGRSARNRYRTHLFAVNKTHANKLGGARTNFYAQAARGTSFKVVGDAVIVSIASVGIAQRYFGGTIRPKTKKYLTIPAIPEAHGKRASEFPSLRVSLEYNPKVDRYMLALVQGARSLIRTRRTKKGVKVINAGVQNTRVVFWLVKQVTQRADPSVLPTMEEVATDVQRDVFAYVERLAVRRAGPAAPEDPTP